VHKVLDNAREHIFDGIIIATPDGRRFVDAPEVARITVALAGAPIDAAEAKQLIARTKAGVKIKGYRGKPAMHEASAVKALVGLSNLIADAGNRIASIDVNPFLINSKVGVAVDALIVLNNEAARKAAKH